VIPTLNEAARIGPCLGSLSGVDEVVVADGGSTDGTPAMVRAHRGARLLDAPRGRARQMNAGARAARGDILVFLHADVRMPPDAARWITRTLARPRTAAGAFRTWTVDDRVPPRTAPWLHLADVRSRVTRIPYGDQALFLRKSTFETVGGFPDQPLMEDLELSLRLRRLGKIRTAPARVHVSGRRFLAHPLRDTLVVNLFPTLYRLGVAPETLARLYENVR
jgi:rSAM/selenodomain-associated transferase 2